MATSMLNYVGNTTNFNGDSPTPQNNVMLIPTSGGNSQYPNNPTRPINQILILFSMVFSNIARDRNEHLINVAIKNSNNTLNFIAKDIPIPYGSTLSMPCKVTLMQNQMLYVWCPENNTIPLIHSSVSCCSMDAVT